MIKKLFAILFGLFVLTNVCHAESYKIYLGIPAGGMTDVFLRKILDVVHKTSNNTYMIVNRPGADQLVAYQGFIEESKKNPNVLFVSSSGTNVSSYYLYPDLKLDPLKDTKPVINFVHMNFIVAMPSDSKINKLSDVKGKLNLGYAGASSATAFNRFVKDPNIELVPFKGDNEVVFALLQKEIQGGIILSVSPQYLVNQDKIKLIHTLATGGNGLSVVSDFPDNKLQEINKEFNAALKDPEVREFFKKNMGTFPAGGTPEDYNKLIMNFKQSIFGK
jgi:tripartite-type tricarboxylate transporter receptor subunit TctC